MTQPPASLDLNNLMAGPGLYPLRVDWVRQQVLFLSVTPDFYANAPFLDQRALPQQQQGQIPSEWASLQAVEALVAAGSAPSNLGLIFHVGHCGSTLVSQALALNEGVFSLREPLPLRDLCERWLERQEPWADVSEAGLDQQIGTMRALWGRTPSAGQRAVVKATSFCCALAEPWLGRHQNDKAVLLAVEPESYLASMVSVPDYMADLKSTAKLRMRSLKNMSGMQPPALYGLSTGELAALAYISDLMAMHGAAKAGGDRVMRLDFDAFLSAPGNALAAMYSFLEAPLLSERIDRLLQNPLFARYSKASAYPFSARERSERLRQARSVHGVEIKKGTAWMEAFADRAAGAAHALEWFGYQL